MSVKENLIVLGQLENAMERFGEGLKKPLDPDNMIRDACIQRFEFTIELFWKVLKKFLLQEKVVATTPRDTLQKAYAFHWIDNETMWLRMMDDRNLTSHTYKDENAEKIYSHLKTYYPLLLATFKFLQNKFKKSGSPPAAPLD